VDNQNLETLIIEISEKSGKPQEEVTKLINQKVEKFSGLLTKQGAAFMVGKELGLNKENSEEIQINELEEGMKGIDVKGKVEIVFPQKEFEKNGKKGKLQSIIINDGNGEVRLTLWNDQVDKYVLTQESEILVSNGIVSTYNEKKQLGLGFNGEIKILKKAEEKFEKLSNLKGGIQSVNVVGKLLRKFPIKEFTSNERTGKLCSFQFGDETALLRATAWNDQATKLDHFNEGDGIELINAYTKDGIAGVELHVGYKTNIKSSEKELPSIQKILKENIPEKKINQLVDGENVTIKGKIKEIEQGNLHYLICSKCGKKISKENGGIMCEDCGEVEAGINPIISLIIEDDTGEIKTVLFGKEVLTVINIEKQKFENELKNKTGEMIIEELKENIIGNSLSIYGYTRENKFNGEREFVVKEIM
jgi:replication factor A1